VRVDILERLADLIRPALSWRPGSPGTKPAGAFDGRSFTATQAMTSLTGSAGEDFASILKALGYRMEKRPPLPVEVAPPVEAVAETAAAPTDAVIESDPAGTEAVASSESVTAEPEAAATDSVADATDETVVPVETVAADSSAARLPGVDFAPPPVAAEPVVEAVAADASVEPVAAVEAAEAATTEAAAAPSDQEAAAAPSDQAVTGATVAATPELVEVWRPGGRSDERRPRHDRSRYKGPDKSAAPAAEGEVAADAEKRERHGRNRRNRNNEHRRPHSDAPAVAAPEGAEAAQARPPRQDRRDDRNEKGGRPPRDNNFKGKDRNQERGKGKFENRSRDGRKDDRGGGALRTYATSAAPRERDRPADPNSPFAKLAALKEQLAGNRKE